MHSATLEQREFEAIQHIRESMQMVENAMLEKEQVRVTYIHTYTLPEFMFISNVKPNFDHLQNHFAIS